MLQLFYQHTMLEAGVDEAGRGCLAGPVFAAAVILPPNFSFSLLDDSKKLNHKNRLLCRDYILQNALDYAIAQVDNLTIDKINILQSSILAMHNALDKLQTQPQFIIVDGNKFKPYKNIAHQTIIKGDGKYMNIAAASILAKTYRDEYMCNIHNEFPIYNWKNNMGYPTLQHRQCVLDNGFTKYHRKTFSVQVSTQVNLF